MFREIRTLAPHHAMSTLIHRPSKFDIHTKIISNEPVAQHHYLLNCECPEIAACALPGQFIHVLIFSGTELLLRRPFTIYMIEGTRISMLYQIIGEGTAALSQLQAGASLHVLGPLGNTFQVPSNIDPAILVGGGAGIASLMLLAASLQESGVRTLAFVGAMNRNRLLSINDLRAIGVQTLIATDDGSAGYQGFVTKLLGNVLEGGAQPHRPENPVVYACGPRSMLQKVTEITQEHQTPAQLAMENRMGCALGVCLGCVCKVRVSNGGFEYQRVCTEGPVFNADDVVW